MTWEDVDTLCYRDLGYCGCFEVDRLWAWLHGVLENLSRMDTDWERFHNQALIGNGDQAYHPMYYLAFGSLDRAGLLEHGSSIRVPFLTDKGRELLKFMDLNPEWLDEDER